jgi:hypothetical protein
MLTTALVSTVHLHHQFAVEAMDVIRTTALILLLLLVGNNQLWHHR